MHYKGILLYGNISSIEKIVYRFNKDDFYIVYNPENSLRGKANKKIPIYILESYEIESNKFIDENIDKLMSFYFLDSGNETNYSQFTKIARKLATYVLRNDSDEAVYRLIIKLWDYRNSGGMLSRKIIELMLNCNMLMSNIDSQQVSNSSYDLRLGDEYFYGGKISNLTGQKPFIEIEPYDYVIASCKETMNFPRDISGRFDISVNLFCQGIILSNSTQVDPGFRGKLFCLLFNTSNKTIFLKKDTHFATLEFHKLLEPTTPYIGKYNDKEDIIHYLPPNVMQGAINELKKEIEQMKKENKVLQNIFLGILSLFLAVIAILLVL